MSKVGNRRTDSRLRPLERRHVLSARDVPTTPTKIQGACKNCGAMGHKALECVERPRSGKKAAMKTGMDIAADDVTTDLTSHGKVHQYFEFSNQKKRKRKRKRNERDIIKEKRNLLTVSKKKETNPVGMWSFLAQSVVGRAERQA